MSEPERDADAHTSGRTPQRRPRLTDRAMRERWAIPGLLRRPLVERLGEIVRDPEAPHCEAVSAVSAILTARKINLANIALTIEVQTHEELGERRDGRSSVNSTCGRPKQVPYGGCPTEGRRGWLIFGLSGSGDCRGTLWEEYE